jgi:hypothetical protein
MVDETLFVVTMRGEFRSFGWKEDIVNELTMVLRVRQLDAELDLRLQKRPIVVFVEIRLCVHHPFGQLNVLFREAEFFGQQSFPRDPFSIVGLCEINRSSSIALCNKMRNCDMVRSSDDKRFRRRVRIQSQMIHVIGFSPALEEVSCSRHVDDQ